VHAEISAILEKSVRMVLVKRELAILIAMDSSPCLMNLKTADSAADAVMLANHVLMGSVWKNNRDGVFIVGVGLRPTPT
jgi:hypothetical protein